MGFRGPAPKPSVVRELEGNPSGRPLNAYEPRPNLISSIEPPEHLSQEGKNVWKALSQELIRIGLLSTIDIEAFSRYINYLLEYRDCQKAIDGKYIITYKNPDGSPKYFQQNPYISLRNAAASNMLKLEREFGMTPAARVRMIALVNGNEGGNGGGSNSDPYGD